MTEGGIGAGSEDGTHLYLSMLMFLERWTGKAALISMSPFKAEHSAKKERSDF
jgi:hypothetical protein